MNNELYHHGIQGQKWGIRRYQNEDGSLTALGRARLGYENTRASVADARTSYYAKRNKQLQAKIENQNLKNQLKAAKNQNKSNNTSDTSKNVSKMSDAELNAAIARLQKENQYKNLLPQKKEEVNTGKEFVKNSLNTIGNKTVDGIATAGRSVLVSFAEKKLKEIISKKTGMDFTDYSQAYEKKKKQYEADNAQYNAYKTYYQAKTAEQAYKKNYGS